MSQAFRALLLSAGYGTRLKPITLRTPKCLVPICGEPLLGRWLRQLESAGCEAVLVNTHYLARQVEDFLKGWNRERMIVSTVHEAKLLGTAGTLIENRDFFTGGTGLMIHADNAMVENLSGFLCAHEQRQSCCLMTMLTFNTKNPGDCGITVTDQKGVVTSFHEKTKHPPGNCANGAIYAFEKPFLEYLSKIRPNPTDFSTEVIPSLMGAIQTWHTNHPYLDIGTPEALSEAQILLR